MQVVHTFAINCRFVAGGREVHITVHGVDMKETQQKLRNAYLLKGCEPVLRQSSNKEYTLIG